MTGESMLGAMLARGQSGPPPAPPGPASPSGGPGMPAPAAGLASELISLLEQSAALMEQMFQQGIPLDPDQLAPTLQRWAHNLAILTARDSGGGSQVADEAAQVTAAAPGMGPRGGMAGGAMPPMMGR